MSRKKASAKPTTDKSTTSNERSGGTNIDAERVDVNGDVIGRDKIVINQQIQAVSERKAGGEDARTTHIRAIIKLADEILISANESLIENEETLLPFLLHPANRSSTRDKLLSLFEKQQYRGLNKRWLTILEEYAPRETDSQLVDILNDLLRAVNSLYETFYSYSSVEIRLHKWSLLKSFEAVDDEQAPTDLIEECRSYLDHLRRIIEAIANCSGRLNSLILS